MKQEEYSNSKGNCREYYLNQVFGCSGKIHSLQPALGVCFEGWVWGLTADQQWTFVLPNKSCGSFQHLTASFPRAGSLTSLPVRFLCTLGAGWATGRELENSLHSLSPGMPQPVGMGASTGMLPLCPLGAGAEWQGTVSQSSPPDGAPDVLSLGTGSFAGVSPSPISPSLLHLCLGPSHKQITCPQVLAPVGSRVKTPPLCSLGFWLGLFNKEIYKKKTIYGPLQHTLCEKNLYKR